MRLFARITGIAVVLSAAAACVGQQPNVVHAQLSSKSASKGLATEVDAVKGGGVAWIGWDVATVSGFHSGWDNGPAYLEGDHPSSQQRQEQKDLGRGVVLLRVDESGVDKVRVESPERVLDGGGTRFVWLTGVAPEESLRYLAGLAQRDGTKRVRDSAIFAVSVHATPGATAALVQLAGPSNDLWLREKAAFWLANERGRDGFLAVQKMAREDKDDAFRDKLTFDLTLSREPEAVPELVRMAHNDPAVKVRRQAQFWMAQKGGKAVTADLREMAENDPEASIRKSAVFAISQLPKEQATGQLIQLAQTGKDPVVRKQAVFWLGQSQDPKALDYLTQLLQK
ncbi:MAG: repeat protein [Acidobacteriaceae bacterium]|nr:repeat protein [Acidobacteriaceae bacterium]